MSRSGSVHFSSKLVIIGTVLLFCVLMISLLIAGKASAKQSSENIVNENPTGITYTTYVVSDGDSIWSIAGTHLTDEFPTYDSFVREVIRANRMSNSTIYPGDLIIIPSGHLSANADNRYEYSKAADR